MNEDDGASRSMIAIVDLDIGAVLHANFDEGHIDLLEEHPD
jgi:hypothetical protein